MTLTHDTTLPPATAAADIQTKRAADRRVLMSRRDCQREGGWGQTTQILKEKRGALRAVLDGSRRLVTTESFYQHLIELASAPPRKVREPPSRYTKRPRPRTPQELAGLARANQARHAAAQRRKEMKSQREPA